MAISISVTIDENGKPQISVGETQAIKSIRESKGKSSILFPDDYVVVDIETTGLSPQYDEIIEIAAIKYKSGVKVDVFSTLVKPQFLTLRQKTFLANSKLPYSLTDFSKTATIFSWSGRSLMSPAKYSLKSLIFS